MKIHYINALNDNYIWCIELSERDCIIIDPSETQPVADFLQNNDLVLKAILVTHHHHDHTGGLSGLLQLYPQARAYAVQGSKVLGITDYLEGNQVFSIGEANIKTLLVPGHTLDHIAFYINDAYLFCGDALFSGGCGRIFEGTPQQMHQSLQRLAELPDHTQVFPAHEYTLANLEFSKTVEPNNAFILEYATTLKGKLDNGAISLPTTIGTEKQINPYFRLMESEVIASVSTRDNNLSIPFLSTSPETVFRVLRQWKDSF